MQGAPVEAGRQVERVEIDEERHERRDEDTKDLAQPERLEKDTGFLPKTTSKTSWKDLQKYSPFRRDHVGDGVDEQVER